ncbi:MAG: DUF5723 family protein [Bacteroidales bacterium]|nr:DUF5723 family protein [Bacteroidales bacterium]
MKKIVIITIYLVITASFGLKAQNNVVLHNFHSVPQSVYTNPSIIPEPKLTVGIPGLSSIYFNYHNSSLTVNDILTERAADDSLDVDIEGMLGVMEEENQMLLNVQNDVLFVGTRINKGYLSLGVNHETNLLFNYPKELIEFVYYGNADERFLNETVDFSATDVGLGSYLAYHVGYSSPIPGFEDLTIGGRLKFLKGMAAISVERMDVNFTTSSDPETVYNLSGHSDFLIHTAGLSTDDDTDITDNLLSNENSGFAIDLGATYKVNDKITASAAITDMGSINWKTALKSYESDFKDFEYDGFYFNEKNDSTDIMQAFTDTLEATFNVTETETEFSTSLPTRFNISGNYKINKKSSAGAMFYGTSYGDTFIPVINLNYNYKVNRAIHLKAAYSIINNTYSNIGLGLSLNLGPIQAYFIGDNLVGLMDPDNARQANLRFGLNVSIFEKPEKTGEEMKKAKETKSPAPKEQTE